SEQEQQNPNGEQKDQQQQGKDSKDQQSMDQKGSEQEKSSESKEESKQEAPNEEAKNQLKGQEERQPQANAQPSGSAGEAKENPGADAPAGEVRQVGEMSRDEALRLLETLGTDERVIVPTPLSERNRGNRATNGKTW
ncbi:MAG: hypothetical protein KDK99_09435, partial [Verrucomicrobiales bacterium]|nr:hypothetical protein [Verrucomicrobiales bacterium]